MSIMLFYVILRMHLIYTHKLRYLCLVGVTVGDTGARCFHSSSPDAVD